MSDPRNPGASSNNTLLSDIDVSAEQSKITAGMARGMISDINDAQKKSELNEKVSKARRIIKKIQQKHAEGQDVGQRSLERINKALKEIDSANNEASEILQKQREEEKLASKNAIKSIAAGNTKGDDLVIGDVHGNSECLKAVIGTLKENDRLFLVGDLTDRGKDSLGVIQLLSDKQYENKIFAVRGNHEELCLAGIAALESRGIRGGSKELLDDYNEYVSDQSKKENFRSKYRAESDILDMSMNGGGWLITLFNEELASSKITISDGVIKYSEDSQIKMIKEYMEKLPYIIHIKGEKPFNVVHADMPINDAELDERINRELGLTKNEMMYATWAREGGNEASIRDVGRTPDSIPTYVGHSVVAHGNVPPVRTNTNTIDIDVESHSTDASLVVNVTQGKSEYIGVGSKKAYTNAKLVGVINTVNKHLNPNNQVIEVNKRKVGLRDKDAGALKGKSRQAVNQAIKDTIDTPNSVYANCKNGKLGVVDQKASLKLDISFDLANLSEDIKKLSQHIAKLREQDFDYFYQDKNGNKVLVKYHTEKKNDPEKLDPIHVNEAEVQAMRYMRGMMIIAKHTTDENVQKQLLKDIHEKYEQYTKSRERPSADLTLWLSDQFASSISRHVGVKKIDVARKQLTMARDLGILLEAHPAVCTVSESKDQVTIETSTPFKVSEEYYKNRELFENIPEQHWFMNAKKLAGFGIDTQDTWMQGFFAGDDFKQVQKNGVAVPPSARWLPIPANNQVVEIHVAKRSEDISKMEFSRTRVLRSGVAIPYDVRKLKWWKSADAEQKKIAKAKLKELMKQQLDERIKEYKEMYGDLIGTNEFNFYANYQTLLSPLKIIDDLGPHVDNNKKFIDLVKEVMKEMDEDEQFKAEYKKQGVNLKVRHTNAAVNRNAGKKIFGKKITTTHEYSDDEKTRREKIAEFNEIKKLVKEAVLPPTINDFTLSDIRIQNLMRNAGYREDLIKELVAREHACQCLQDLLDNKEPYKNLDRYQRNIMMAALEHLAMGSQSLTIAGCKSARDRTGVVLCAIKTMQENSVAMTDWDVLEKGIVKSLQQGHAFRSMIFHSAIVKVSLVHKNFMEQLKPEIQMKIGKLLIFSRKPPEYKPVNAQHHNDVYPNISHAHESLFHHDKPTTSKMPKNDSKPSGIEKQNIEENQINKLNSK